MAKQFPGQWERSNSKASLANAVKRAQSYPGKSHFYAPIFKATLAKPDEACSQFIKRGGSDDDEPNQRRQ
jgi:hypothetical protein